ncbi:transposase family protein [Streptomyces herbicida]|uniref:transposase family protein n=1 Tax=Streptomyces herbicida TaxID=3065675 RepID=UPI00292E93AF|nr:transposase family protein [Streptomyces sp. NEAU-HV9]
MTPPSRHPSGWLGRSVRRRGRRYQLPALVTAAAASVLAGARSLTAITEWISDAPAWAGRVLGFPLDPLSGTGSVPHPHTLRRLLVQLDGDALDQAIGAFLAARTTPTGPGLRAIAVDGKALRGSRTTAAPYMSPCSPRWTTPVTSWPSARSPTRATRSPPSSPCWTAST